MHFNIHDAKAQLSLLLDRALAGEEIIITRAGIPLVRLTPVKGSVSRSGVRLGGLKASRLKLAKGFHDSMSDNDLLS